jgi:hypothetical protein
MLVWRAWTLFVAIVVVAGGVECWWEWKIRKWKEKLDRQDTGSMCISKQEAILFSCCHSSSSSPASFIQFDIYFFCCKHTICARKKRIGRRGKMGNCARQTCIFWFVPSWWKENNNNKIGKMPEEECWWKSLLRVYYTMNKYK